MIDGGSCLGELRALWICPRFSWRFPSVVASWDLSGLEERPTAAGPLVEVPEVRSWRVYLGEEEEEAEDGSGEEEEGGVEPPEALDAGVEGRSGVDELVLLDMLDP